MTVNLGCSLWILTHVSMQTFMFACVQLVCLWACVFIKLRVFVQIQRIHCLFVFYHETQKKQSVWVKLIRFLSLSSGYSAAGCSWSLAAVRWSIKSFFNLTALSHFHVHFPRCHRSWVVFQSVSTMPPRCFLPTDTESNQLVAGSCDSRSIGAWTFDISSAFKVCAVLNVPMSSPTGTTYHKPTSKTDCSAR